MNDITHTRDRKATYRSQWGAVDYIHEYGVDIEKREIYLFGREEYMYGTAEDGGKGMSEPGVEYTMSNQFIKNIRLLQSLSSDPILIHMKTCGGDWMEGMAIYQAIRACPNYVTILNYTHARSMSSLIFLAADWRVMMPYSIFMLHKGTYDFGGTVKQAYTEMEQLKKADKEMMDIYVKCLQDSESHKDRTEKQITQWLEGLMNRKEEVYFSAQEAVDLNFADLIFGENGIYDWGALRKR